MKQKTKRHLLMFRLYLLTIFGCNQKKVDCIRKSKLFKQYGGGGYWHPIVLPTHPDIITIGENVIVAADVKFFDHDLVNIMLNDSGLVNKNVSYYKGEIEIGNNVMIGGNSILLYDTHIGNNVIIAAGSVVKGNIPDNVVIGGNPAKIICDIDTFLKKRLSE